MLEVHRSHEAGNPEQSSRRYVITKDVMSLIALRLLLLVSLSLTLTILNEDPLWLVCIIHAPQKDRFTRRNQRLYTFNEHRIKTIYRKQGNNIHVVVVVVVVVAVIVGASSSSSSSSSSSILLSSCRHYHHCLVIIIIIPLVIVVVLVVVVGIIIIIIVGRKSV